MINWNTKENRILINPRFPEEEKKKNIELIKKAPPLTDHFWIATSGSTGAIKWAALSRDAILASAQAVNFFLDCQASDIWLNPLPYFHVGGLGIFARAYLTGSQVVDAYDLMDGKWNTLKFCDLLSTTETTLTSLVPAQVYDLVNHKKIAPKSLRGVIVGGGAMSEELYTAAKILGWPLLPSYGLTECASQVATASVCDTQSPFPKLHLLSHIEAKINREGKLLLKSPALLTLYALIKEGQADFCDPKREGWFETEDLAEIKNGALKIKGRTHYFIKIGGESVDLLRLEQILEGIKLKYSFSFDLALAPIPDDRLGHVIHLMVAKTEEPSGLANLIQDFNNKVLPFEKIRCTKLVPHIPRTDLGKVKIKDLIYR